MKKILFLIAFLVIGIFTNAQIYDPVKWEFSQTQLSDKEIELQFKANIQEHWHLYSQHIDDEIIATKFTFFYNGDTINVKPAESNSIEQYEPLWEMTLRFFEHEAIFKQKVTINSTSDIQ